MSEVFAGKVRKTSFFQKAGFPGNSDKKFGIYYNVQDFLGRDFLQKVSPRNSETLSSGHYALPRSRTFRIEPLENLVHLLLHQGRILGFVVKISHEV
jgi:hypothetical protein